MIPLPADCKRLMIQMYISQSIYEQYIGFIDLRGYWQNDQGLVLIVRQWQEIYIKNNCAVSWVFWWSFALVSVKK